MNRVTIEICLGTSCYLLGAQDLINCIDRLPAETKERLEVRGISCLNTCGKGPNVRINGNLFTSVNPQMLIELIHDQLD